MSGSRKTLGLKLGRKRGRVDSDPGSERSTRPKLSDSERHLSEGDNNPVNPVVEDSGIGPSAGLTIPGFNYLGPGNPLDNGQPTNQVDEVARQHDIRYAQAQGLFEQEGNEELVFQAIQEADSIFLEDLSEIEPVTYTESFGKLVGQTGIGVKRSIEGLFHSTLYPHFKTKMDVDTVDGETNINSTNYTLSAIPSNSILSVNEGVKNPQVVGWKFNKHFNISLECRPLEYTKTEASANLAYGKTEVTPYIHSLPWEKLYFYLTEREYHTIINTFHSAYVDSVTVKIYNMGVTSTAIQSVSTSFKTLSSNQYLGVWRNYEKYGPVKLGTKITPTFLYGNQFGKVASTSTSSALPEDSYGAITEMKTVDNRISYPKITSEWKTNAASETEESRMLPPPLFEMATIVADASRSVGLLYQTTYKPKDGLFHNRSSAFHNAAVIQHKPYEVNVDLAGKGKMTDAKYKITDSVKENNPAIKYEDATVDNMFFRSLRSTNQLGFIDGLGIGLFPKRQKDNTVPDATLDLYIQTTIQIKGEAFGGSVLFGGNSTGPQCNPNRIYFIHDNKKFGNAYAADGLPTLSNVSN